MLLTNIVFFIGIYVLVFHLLDRPHIAIRRCRLLLSRIVNDGLMLTYDVIFASQNVISLSSLLKGLMISLGLNIYRFLISFNLFIALSCVMKLGEA
jgi:hypothetical protein